MAPTDNSSGPRLGLYEWGLTDNNNKSQSRNAWMATSLNRTTLDVEDFLPTDSWANLEGNSYIFNAAAQYLRANPGANYILTVGLLPGSGATPASGTSLANGAAGSYNSYFAALATNLVTAGIADRTIIRLGHEFNGSWYAWGVSSDANAVNYANYWKQVVPAMHAVSGASGIKFCWCGTVLWDSYNVADAYPGNAYVDYVGVDIYDSCYATDTYPYPSGDSAADMLQRQKNAWTANSGTANNGLQWWSNLASTNSKPFCIPEWGTWGIDSSGRGGGDDSYYIQQMYNFIQNTTNNVAFSVYFDVWADGNHQLCQAPSVAPTAFPNSWTLFQQLFSVPPFTTNNDIGTTGVAGGCAPFSATGAGAGFLAGGTSDNFHFASEAILGNTLCLAQITSASISTGQAGLMIRQSAAVSDPYAALYISNGNLILQSRTSAGSAAMQNEVIGSVSTPIWIKMLRTGNTIAGFESTDGLNWTFAGSQTVTMTASAYAGVAISSGSTTTLNMVGISHVNNADVAADVYNTSTAAETSTTPAITSASFIDSASSSVSKVGTWTVSGTKASLYGGTMLTCYAPTSSASLTFTPTIAASGQYDVYFTAPGNYQDGDQTPVTVTSVDGVSGGTINQQSNDGLWVYLGTFNFAAGATGNFKMTNTSPGGYGYVSADGLMIVPVPSAPLAAPTGLTATSGSGQISLTWMAVSGASAYHVKRSTTSGGPYATLASPTTGNYADPTPVNGTTYYYVVSAVTSAGSESVNSTQVSAALGVPGSVTGVVQGTTTSSTMGISWNAASGATSYNIAYQTSGDARHIVSTASSSYTLTGLTSGVWYWIQVQGVNSAGTGPWTSVYSFETH